MKSKRIIVTLIKKYELHEKSHWLFNEEPTLEQVLSNLLKFITVHFEGNKLPLFDECLINAFSRVNEKHSLSFNINVFLQDLVKNAHVLIDKKIAVETQNGMTAWIPMQESISNFLDRYECTDPVMLLDDDEVVKVSNKEASLMLSVHIMPAYMVSMAVQSICEVCNE